MGFIGDLKSSKYTLVHPGIALSLLTVPIELAGNLATNLGEPLGTSSSSTLEVSGGLGRGVRDQWLVAIDNFWLVVSTPLKHISQWEGLSHILWKIKNV